ncbi:MAG: acyl-CoA synthetase [Deltaproteobacteria bacterium]|nr:acyl-CoA synthetase [Deltaproteobacteria bacterium]MDP7463304.1 acyl-CoA synthetase [SAR324 cluster bacterium]
MTTPNFLQPRECNYQQLSPLTFLERSAWIHRNKAAVVHGDQCFTYPELFERSRRLASALAGLGIGYGDTVSAMLPNVPPLLEAHFGIPALGAVLNALNIRLDASTIAHILDHGGAKVLITDTEFAPIIKEALALAKSNPLVIDYADPTAPEGERLGTLDYEESLASGNPEHPWNPPANEWDSISLNYTSGTTGNPKGVLFHHRGAHLAGLCNPLTFGMTPETVYLWTLPMFHCNGWCYTWGVTAVGGTHVCLRKFDPARVFALLQEQRVTHMCGAPIILNALANAPEAEGLRFEQRIRIATGGAAPPSTVIAAMEPMNFEVLHFYGLTESYGPATVCEWQAEWNELDLQGRAAKTARQGVICPSLREAQVLDQDSGQPVPADGATIGEIVLRGSTIMKGYHANTTATADAFAGGWYHTGDLAVMHPDGYLEVKDRSKDIIISGGENISSLEVEEALYKHPAVLEVAVVARPDEKWGETPCACVTLKPGQSETEAGIVAFCRDHLAHYKCPRTVIFTELPKTSTGKIQKHILREQAQAL